MWGWRRSNGKFARAGRNVHGEMPIIGWPGFFRPPASFFLVARHAPCRIAAAAPDVRHPPPPRSHQPPSIKGWLVDGVRFAYVCPRLCKLPYIYYILRIPNPGRRYSGLPEYICMQALTRPCVRVWVGVGAAWNTYVWRKKVALAPGTVAITTLATIYNITYTCAYILYRQTASSAAAYRCIR